MAVQGLECNLDHNTMTGCDKVCVLDPAIPPVSCHFCHLFPLLRHMLHPPALTLASQHLCPLSAGLFSNVPFLYAVGGSILGQMLVIYFGPLQKIFQTEALSLEDLVLLTSLAASVWLVDEVRKALLRRTAASRAAPVVDKMTHV